MTHPDVNEAAEDPPAHGGPAAGADRPGAAGGPPAGARADGQMSTRLVTAHPDDRLEELRARMRAHRVHALPVVERDGRLVGIVTSLDLLARPEHADARARDVMQRRVLTVPRYARTERLVALMRGLRLHHVVVTERGLPVGIVSALDLLRDEPADRAPTLAAPGPDVAAPRLRAAPERPARVLLACDRALVRARVEAALAARGHVVARHEEAESALAAVDRSLPEVVVVDAAFDGERGLELVGRLRLVHAELALPVLLLVDDLDPSTALRAAAAGVSELVELPPSPPGREGSPPGDADPLLGRLAFALARCERLGRGYADLDLLPGGAGPAFDRYEVRRVLGRGGSGVVYDAWDLREDRPVALKVLGAAVARTPDARQRLLREAYALAAVRSPHIARLVEYGTQEGRAFLVMERVFGPDLQELLEERGALPRGEVLALLRGLAAALEALERANLVHRDVKPGNIILRRADPHDPVLVDFGLAKHPHDRGVTSPDVIMGTPPYMAPELYRANVPQDVASDVYALGLVARFAATGQEPLVDVDGLSWAGPGPSGRSDAGPEEPGPWLADEPLDPDLRALLDRMADRDPARRPRPADLLVDLEALAAR